MRKFIYALILPLVVVSGLVFANREIKKEPVKKPTSNPFSAAAREDARKKWEATPDGVRYKNWVASPKGRKVFAAISKIRKHVKEYTEMEGVVTSLSLPPGSLLGYGVMVKINNDDYILCFGPEKSDNNLFGFNKEYQQSHSLKVNDKIIIKSHTISHAPKYSYPIISGDYIERDNKLIFKRAPRKGGC